MSQEIDAARRTLEGQVAIVTGAGKRVGARIARALVEDGWGPSGTPPMRQVSGLSGFAMA